MKKSIFFLLTSTLLFAASNNDNGFLELGVNTIDYKYNEKGTNNIEKSIYMDNIGFEMNYLDKIGKNIYIGFNGSYLTGDVEQGSFKIINTEGLLKYDLINKNRYKMGLSGSFGWKYLDRTFNQETEHYYIYSNIGTYIDYYLTKDITIGVDLKYFHSFNSKQEKYIVNNETNENVFVSNNLGNTNGMNLSIPIGLRMEENTWLYLEYQQSNILSKEKDVINEIEIKENKISMKVRWKW